MYFSDGCTLEQTAFLYNYVIIWLRIIAEHDQTRCSKIQRYTRVDGKFNVYVYLTKYTQV